jgi:hypothetical protein
VDRRFVPLSISPSKFQIVAFIWTSKPTICQSDCFPWLIWGTLLSLRTCRLVRGCTTGQCLLSSPSSPGFLMIRQWRRSRGTSNPMAATSTACCGLVEIGIANGENHNFPPCPPGGIYRFYLHRVHRFLWSEQRRT